jgi:hypothetical protein
MIEDDWGWTIVLFIILVVEISVIRWIYSW